MSRQTSVDYSDSTLDVGRGYDAAGRLQAMTDGSGTVTYSFDDADRLTGITRAGGGAGLNGTFSYNYDDAGNITGRTYPDATTTGQVFDGDGRLTSISSAGSTTSLGYDEAGNLTTVTLPSGNGHVATRSYDRAGRLTTVENAKAGTILSEFLWTLDPAGNPTKQQTTRGAGDTYDAFEYDARNRLTAACYGVAATATDCTGAANKISYAYDKVSNRTQEVRTGSVPNPGTTDYTYNAADQLTQTVKGAETTSYTYDANGNETSAGSRTFTYNLADEVVSATAAGTTTTYSYDGDGRRVSSTVGGGGADLRLTWDPLADTGIPELALERTTAGGLVRRYLHGPIGALNYTEAGGTFSYHHDPLGTVTDVTDSTGAAQWKYEYEAYGALLTTTNVSGSAPENRLRFNGQQLDPEAGLYHLRARQYDPATGRFGALDPLENPLFDPYAGPYVYVNGRPTTLVDPLGLRGWDDIKNKASSGLKIASNATAGALDTVTFGQSAKFVRVLDPTVDTNSKSFKLGQLAGNFAGASGVGRFVAKQAVRRGLARRARLAGTVAGGATSAALAARDIEDAEDVATLGGLTVAGGGLGYLSARCLGSVLGVAAKSATSGAELLSGAASATYRGDLTVAGRALAKHGGRPGSAFPRPVGAPGNISAQAQSVVDDILANQYRRATSFNPRLNTNVVDIFDASGRGLRYTEEGRFVGFLEPPR